MPVNAILKVSNLSVQLPVGNRVVKAVNGVNLELFPGKVLGLVGESGCGKTITCLALLGLIKEKGWFLEGEAIMNGKNLFTLSPEETRRLRGGELGLILQNPSEAFNPLLNIGSHCTETICTHLPVSRKEAQEIAENMLSYVNLPEPRKIMRQYPFQLSGGMLQRVMIAIAISVEPNVLIADEPTTSLDVTVQRQILGLLVHLKKKHKTGILLVSHDLGVIAQMADEVAVMYAGTIVEQACSEQLFKKPLHPYTRALLASKLEMKRKKCGV